MTQAFRPEGLRKAVEKYSQSLKGARLAFIDNDVTADATDVRQDEKIRICLFSIEKDTYAIPVDVLMEIIIAQNIFPVPTTPSHVLGVINLRGNIVPIVDIRPALSLPQQSVPGQIAILKLGSMMLGIAVDNVSAVIPLPRSSIRAPRNDAAEKQAANGNRFLKGIIQRDDGVAALLDIGRVIDEVRLA